MAEPEHTEHALPSISPPPDSWVAIEQIAVLKCIDDEGEPALVIRSSDGLTTWEALGMLEAAASQQRARLNGYWEEED